ncbi:MAG: hypothetical protein FWG97_03445 [Deltaproteobacteria bacterium]|nr:hypothetical protein [Deltaproteobacteria bacterium]
MPHGRFDGSAGALNIEGLRLADEAGQLHGPLDLTVRPGEMVLVVVQDLGMLRRLMKCCLAFEQPDSGRLTWWPGAVVDLGGWSDCAFFRQIGYVDRQSQLLYRWSLLDHFRFFQLYAGLSDGPGRGLELLKTFGLEAQAETPAENLPEPLRRLALYALALFQRPRLALLERPFQFLDRDFGLVWGLIKNRVSVGELAVAVFDRGQDIYPPGSFSRVVVF